MEEHLLCLPAVTASLALPGHRVRQRRHCKSPRPRPHETPHPAGPTTKRAFRCAQDASPSPAPHGQPQPAGRRCRSLTTPGFAGLLIHLGGAPPLHQPASTCCDRATLWATPPPPLQRHHPPSVLHIGGLGGGPVGLQLQENAALIIRVQASAGDGVADPAR